MEVNMSLDNWAMLCELQGGFEEDQLRAFLRANGIQVKSRGEALRHTHAMVMDGLGRVEILVPEEQLEEARDLLKKVESGTFRLEDGAQPPE